MEYAWINEQSPEYDELDTLHMNIFFQFTMYFHIYCLM